MESTTSFKTVYNEEIYNFSPPVTIVIEISWDEINDGQRQLLSKILQAVKQSLESVRILSLPKFDLSSYQEKPSKIIAFTTPPKGFGLYEVVQTGDTSVVFSDPLESLITDDGAKRKLWSALKEMF